MTRSRSLLLLGSICFAPVACGEDGGGTDDDASTAATGGAAGTSETASTGSMGTSGTGAGSEGGSTGSGGGPMASEGAVVLYTDLASAPLGAYVTLFGRRLQTAPVTGATVYSQTETEIVIVWEGNQVQVDGVEVPVTTIAGTVYEATPATFYDIVEGMAPGDVVYLHEGTYDDQYGTTTWGDERLTLGSWASGTAFIGFPGEEARLDTARLEDGAGFANGVTLANLRMQGWSCVHGGSWWQEDESGATDARIVNVDCFGDYGDQNTMTGLVGLGGDGWRILGNRFSNDAPAPINNNHAVYITVGADDVEVAWNRFSDMRMGHVIQQHTDGPERTYENISIHDNEIVNQDPNDTRGIVISACDASSSARIYNNVILNAGQDFSGIAVYCGNVEVLHNTLYTIQGSTLLMQWGESNVISRNNVFIGDPQTISTGNLTESDNVTAGDVDGQGRLVPAVPAPNVGIDIDHDGWPRGDTTAVGAFAN